MKEKARQRRIELGLEQESSYDEEEEDDVSVGGVSHKSAISNINGRVRETRFERNL